MEIKIRVEENKPNINLRLKDTVIVYREGEPQEVDVEYIENGEYVITPDDGVVLENVNIKVNVPIPEGYVKPEGTLEITQNGEYDVTQYAQANVNVELDTSIEDKILTGTLTEYTNNRITSLKDYAFFRAKLKYFNSTSLTTLGGLCFSKSQLIECNIPNAQYATSGASFDDCTKLTKLYLPNMSSSFSNNCKGCTSLAYVYFEKVSTISNNCFSGCTSLTTLIINKTSLCTLGSTNVFTNTPIASGTGYIYVQDDLVESYKAATNWSTYADQIKPLSEYVEE